MVEVHAQQARMSNKGFVVASGKRSRKCAIIEVCSLKRAGLFGIAKRSQFFGSVFGIIADNVIVGIGERNRFMRFGVADWGAEERKQSLPTPPNEGLLDCGDLAGDCGACPQ